MVISITSQILILSGMAIIGLLINRLVKLELTLACLLVGFVTGLGLDYIDYVNFDTGIRAYNLKDIVFFVILPVLIFEAAWHLQPGRLKRWLAPILVLATLGVVISCFVTAGIVYIGIGHDTGFPWIAALLTGAILSATDPIAVISQLKALNVPEDLTALFEGESLFNDTSAVVLFAIVISLASGTSASESNNVIFFATVFFGGMIVGLIIGLLAAAVALLVANASATPFILVYTAFSSFYVAEHIFHVSGIMAVMVAALVTRVSLKEVKNTIANGVSATWEWLGLFFNSLLFVIMGLVITVAMFTEQWLAMLIAIAASLLARSAAVIVSGWVTKPLDSRISKAWQILLVWGGLRGAIAIALVLSLPVSLPYWWTIQSMVFGVVVFSLVVQGTTNKALIKKYGHVS